ncbi:phosphatidate cytidylyltransferase [Chloroflexota bacterium]
MLKKRIITALLAGLLLLAAVWAGEPWFTIFVAIWGVLAVLEFYKLVTVSKKPFLNYLGIIWTLLFILSPHFKYDFLTPLLLTSAVILSLICLLFLTQKTEAFVSWAWTMAGILYIGWLLSYLVALRGLDDTGGWVFFALFTTFGCDTAAFFVGRALGRHRLAPYISPGKTWEGAVAGVFGAMIMSLVLVMLLNLPIGYGMTIVLSLLVSILGQFGDLIESLLKRNVGVKDSGKLLPGHGGFLDRIDSIVFAGVVVYYYVIWAM